MISAGSPNRKADLRKKLKSPEITTFSGLLYFQYSLNFTQFPGNASGLIGGLAFHKKSPLVTSESHDKERFQKINLLIH